MAAMERRVPYVGRKNDPAIHRVLWDWAGWRRSLGKAQGWGAKTLDLDSYMGQRCPGTHSDKVLAELIKVEQAGQGIYRLVDARVNELHAMSQRIMVARYCGMLSWEGVADVAGVDCDNAKLLHRRAVVVLRSEVVRYMHIDREARATYGVMFRTEGERF